MSVFILESKYFALKILSCHIGRFGKYPNGELVRVDDVKELINKGYSEITNLSHKNSLLHLRNFAAWKRDFFVPCLKNVTLIYKLY